MMTDPAATQQPQIIFPAGAQVVITNAEGRKLDESIYTVQVDVSSLTQRVPLLLHGELMGAPYAKNLRAATPDDYTFLSSRKKPTPEVEIETLPNGAKQSKLGHWWNLPHAMLAVAEVMNKGHITYDKPDATPDKPNFAGIPAWSSIQHALTHLMLHQVGNTDEPHLHHAAARILMAIEVIEGGHDKT